MLARRGLQVVAAVFVLAAASGGASASAPPSVSVDVIAWPGEAPGPLQWKLWHVQASEPIRSITLVLPAGGLRPSALRALMSAPQAPEGARVGVATVTMRRAPDLLETTASTLLVSGCPGAAVGDLATLRFATGDACATLALRESEAGVVARIDLHAPDVTALDLRVDSLQTAAGRLLPPNPTEASTADTSVTVETASGTAHDTVREVAGGATSLTVGVDPTRLDYGHGATVSGLVLRGGAPAAGELVALDALTESVASWPGEPIATATTDTDGHFAVTVRPTYTERLAAWASAAATVDRVRLNTLAGVSPTDVVVRAPKPSIERRRATRVRGRLVRAEIAVRDPLPRETLQCRLYVGGKLFALRRFPSGASLVFHVIGRRDANARAVVGRWTGLKIAPRSSRVVRLWPRNPRRP